MRCAFVWYRESTGSHMRCNGEMDRIWFTRFKTGEFTDVRMDDWLLIELSALEGTK